MSRRISTVILDWAGTTVDFGCFAPVNAFIAAFEAYGITPTLDETRAPMGLHKRVHIQQMLSGLRISAEWRALHGRDFTDKDVTRIYERFESALFSTLDGHADIIPGVEGTIAALRGMEIKLGSTTGYTRAMMDVVAPAAAAGGYAPDCLVCPDDTGGVGRPFPYMVWRNVEILGARAISEVIKVGDTVADMEEGRNAGCLTVGVVKGSSMLGLSREEYDNVETERLMSMHHSIRRQYMDVGADIVIDSITELPDIIDTLNKEHI